MTDNVVSLSKTCWRGFTQHLTNRHININGGHIPPECFKTTTERDDTPQLPPPRRATLLLRKAPYKCNLLLLLCVDTPTAASLCHRTAVTLKVCRVLAV